MERMWIMIAVFKLIIFAMALGGFFTIFKQKRKGLIIVRYVVFVSLVGSIVLLWSLGYPRKMNYYEIVAMLGADIVVGIVTAVLVYIPIVASTKGHPDS